MGIGYKNKLPFVCPEEMKHFRETTSKPEDPQKKNLVNIYKIAYNAINNIGRPTYLCRETNNHPLKPSVG